RAADGVEAERLHAVEAVLLAREPRAADGAPAHEPVERDPGVIARDAGRVRPRADREPGREHAADGRRLLGRLRAVAVDEVLALVRHAMLDRDAAAERANAVDVARRDRLGVVEEPAQAAEGHLAVD